MNDEEKVVFECNDDPFAEPLHIDDSLSFDVADRRDRCAQHEGTKQANMRQRLAGNSRGERFAIDDDIR
jgi:hypothetical protein